MRGSKHVTDLGLGFLGQSTCCESLESIDITFYVNTTYEGTLALRNSNRLPNLRVIRRQPIWLDGHFETPFEEEDRRELHTYHVDGSFNFRYRDVMSHGFVRQLTAPLRTSDDKIVERDIDDDDSCSFFWRPIFNSTTLENFMQTFCLYGYYIHINLAFACCDCRHHEQDQEKEQPSKF
jgi:hypothetical protein